VLILPKRLINQIITHVRQHEQIEACGLLSRAGNQPGHYYAVKNIAADPSVRFEMEPKQLIAAMKHMRVHGEDLLAIVHSHPASPPLPSAADIDECGYPNAYYIIVSLDNKPAVEMRAYRMTNAGMQSVELYCEDGDIPVEGIELRKP
jgi:proteasome lid subunit RPN8/RPN11